MPYVLIADDEFVVRMLIRETLASDPRLTFIETADGRQALNAAIRETPDLIILDIMMPYMNGLEVCRIIKATPHLKAIPVLLISAKPEEEVRAMALHAGAVGFISKPFEPVELERVAHRILYGDPP